VRGGILAVTTLALCILSFTVAMLLPRRQCEHCTKRKEMENLNEPQTPDWLGLGPNVHEPDAVREASAEHWDALVEARGAIPPIRAPMKTWTMLFRLGPEPRWCEWQPSVAALLRRVTFNEPVTFLNYAHGATVAHLFPSSRIVREIPKDIPGGGFHFGGSIQPPHGVISFLLSTDEETEVEMVFHAEVLP
jgi:hypothetical protein